MSGPTVLTEQFRAMGADAEITIVGGSSALMGGARRRLEGLESRWSRFRPTSEVCRMNASAGAAVRVSADTLLLVERATLGATLTAGRFDPLQLRAIRAIGYRTTFAEIDRPSVTERASRRPSGLPVVDPARRSVTIPAGTGFDPGGIGKGLAADIVAAELLAAGATGACVSLGGDVRVVGTPPVGDAWVVAVRNLPGDEPVAFLALEDGAVATSSRSRRRWSDADGRVHHHIVDPTTGASATSPVTFGSVVAACAWQAEVLSTVVALDGDAGLARAHELGAAAGYCADGRWTTGPGWDRFARELEVVA